MKKSTNVPATLIITMAAGTVASGCSGSYYDQCEDASGRPLPDSYCHRSTYVGAHWVHVQSSGFGGSGGSGGVFGG
jgi:hypothetical protein